MALKGNLEVNGVLSETEAAPVQVEGGDLSVVSLQVHKVEDVLRSLLISLLPGEGHTQQHARIITYNQDVAELDATSLSTHLMGLNMTFP